MTSRHNNWFYRKVTLVAVLSTTYILVLTGWQEKQQQQGLKEQSEGGGEVTEYTKGETTVLTNCMWHLGLTLTRYLTK